MQARGVLIISFIISYATAIEIKNMTRSYVGFYCELDFECRNIIGPKSFCFANECQCLPHFHINNLGTCIRDRGLKEACDSDDECYWGPEMVNKLECNLGVCSCVPGYIPDKGRICVRYFDVSGGHKNAAHFLELILAAMGTLIFRLIIK